MAKGGSPASSSKGPPSTVANSLSTAPSGFPSSVSYLTAPLPSPGLPKPLASVYCAPCPPSLFPNPPPRLAIKSPTSPLCGQAGLFNAGSKAIPRGTWIRDYLGVVHLEKEADSQSDYDLSLERHEDGEVVGIDATKRGNEARFVNDYRGWAERPNAEFQLRSWEVKDGQGKVVGVGRRMAIYAGPRGVEKGAELCVSYGRGFWRERMKEGENEEAEED
ncbi:hypothetical protein BCR35DRAFT_57673 [Leucosporidium creatinivorum]|uniref:SET domain-containing protein n=1 Tax=Leucosporidium creatinivorum TaxID=106004 RepID=A0A1Y2FKZ5_9BASI|nr:hypothetical protein BCR35DRAFT_57673 [Leucosporidium creatinivorum]